LSLKEFYDFYDRVITYSILSLNSENAKKTEVSPGEETNEETTRKSSIKDDENLCAICFEKPFDVILPCLVKKYVKIINNENSIVSVMIVAQCGMVEKIKQSVQCAEQRLMEIGKKRVSLLLIKATKETLLEEKLLNL